MNYLEAELKIVLADEYSFQPDWRKRWMQIIRGSRTVQFKYAWLHNQYSECNELNPFTDRWWVQVPTPLRIKYLRGNAGVPMDSDARGFPLPSDFAETLLHFTFVKYLSSITRWGIKAGINCGKSSGNCVHLSAAEYDATQYRTCVQRLAQGDLELPHAVGFPPKPENNAKVVVNYAKLYDLNPELCEDESFSITCKAKFEFLGPASKLLSTRIRTL